MRRLDRPGDRGPAAVATDRVDGALRRHDRVLQPELVAGIEERCPAQGEQHDRERTGPAERTAEPAAQASYVVVAEHPRRPRIRWQHAFDRPDQLGPPAGVPAAVE